MTTLKHKVKRQKRHDKEKITSTYPQCFPLVNVLILSD